MPSAPSSDLSPSPRPGETREPILLRVGEIFLKGRNRKAFVRQLLRNLRRATGDVAGVHVENLHLRPVVWHPPGARREVLRRLGRVFGVESMSPAVTVAADAEVIATRAAEMARAWPAGTTFKVDTRRRDKRFPIPSMELSAQVGGHIARATGLAVDVRRPDRTVYIEIGTERSFLFGDRLPGPGGLPVGASGNLTLLLSGGIDSPVAGWSGMRRGCTVNAVYFHSFPYTGDKTREKVLDLARLLARWQGKMAVSVIHFTDVQKRLRGHRREDLVVLMYRRMMMRVATEVARLEDAKGLVTGESLAQVASQTLDNLGVVGAAAGLPVLRPLIAFDKSEIIARAQHIGTYDKSIEPYEDSCSLFVPPHPATRARLQDLDNAETSFDIGAIVAELVASRERVVVSSN